MMKGLFSVAPGTVVTQLNGRICFTQPNGCRYLLTGVKYPSIGGPRLAMFA